MAQSWAVANKFRLFVIVVMSILTSVAALPVDGFTTRTIVGLCLQAGIAGFAFLLCPSTVGSSMAGK